MTIWVYTVAVWRSPVLLEPELPPADDPAVAAILGGLCRATGASGCTLSIQLLPRGPRGRYSEGEAAPGDTLSIVLEVPEVFSASCLLTGAGTGPAASPAAVEALGPLLEGALQALIQHSNARRQVDLLAGILETATEATFVIEKGGDILYANPQGDELLALHTRTPLARLGDDPEPAPLLHLVQDEIGRAAHEDGRVHQQSITLGDGSLWKMEIISLSSSPSADYYLVAFSPIRFPEPEEIQDHLAAAGVSRREASVIAEVLRGGKTCEIADALGISEYTVKDHLKHIYAKLEVASRAQLLAHLAASGLTAGRAGSS